MTPKTRQQTRQHPAPAPASAPAPAPKIASQPAPAPAAPAPKSTRQRRAPVARLVASMAYARKTLTAAERHSRAADGWPKEIGEHLALALDALGDAQTVVGAMTSDWQPMRKARGRKAAAPIEIGSTVVFRPKVAAKYAALGLDGDSRLQVVQIAAGLMQVHAHGTEGEVRAFVPRGHVQPAKAVQS